MPFRNGDFTWPNEKVNDVVGSETTRRAKEIQARLGLMAKMMHLDTGEELKIPSLTIDQLL